MKKTQDHNSLDSKTSADSRLSEVTSIGGAYTAKRNGDGTYDIYDVEIMAEVPKGEKGAPEDIGRAWLQAAVDKAQERLKSGYMAPLHIRHHETGVNTVPAGFMVPTRLERRPYDGRDLWTMLADLRRVPAGIFDQIRNVRIPYRSVEVARWSKPEIQSLALLEDDAPYFKFELLTIGSVIGENKPEASRLEAVEAPAMAYAAAGEGALVLFSFRGGKMADEKKEEIKDEKPAEGAEIKPEVKPEAAPEAKPEAGAALEENVAGPVTMKELEAFGTRLLSAIKTIVMKDADLPKEENKPADQKTDKHEDGASMKESAALEARLNALETSNQIRDSKEKIETLVRDAREQLKGYPTTDMTVAKMRTIAEKDASGEALKAFVDTYKTAVPKDPPSRVEDIGAPKMDAPEVMEFSKHGPAALERARKFSALYDEVVKAGLTDVSRARFMEIQMRQDGAAPQK